MTEAALSHHDTGHPDPTEEIYSKTVFGFWVYLMTDCILFATLFATYGVLHTSTNGGPGAKELFSLPFALARDRLLWLPLFIGLFFILFALTGTWMFPHSAAPGAAVFFVLVLQSMRTLDAWHIGSRHPGRNIVRGLAILFVISFFQVGIRMAAQDPARWYFQRQALLEKLRHAPGKSLVIVKYDPSHNPNREWVYNEADILNAKVILARDMGPANKELLDYFHDRTAWQVRADSPNPQLIPCSTLLPSPQTKTVPSP